MSTYTEYYKKYYENHKQQHKEYYQQRMKCPDCKAEYCLGHKYNHLKTKKHLKAIKNKVEVNKYDQLLNKYNKLKANIKN
jgi:hypothetical protein